MFNLILPHGSKRRELVRSSIIRIKSHRHHKFHRQEYSMYRNEYYRNLTKLRIDGQNQPLISIIVPCYNTPHRYLYELIDSVFAQGYEKWELVLVDASTTEEASNLIKQAARRDTRISYIRTANKGIALNTNVGLLAARGEYVAFLDHDDTLDPDALAENAQVIINHRPDLIYSDEDKITDDSSEYFAPHFKPDFSLAMLRCVNYITHFVVVKKAIVKKVSYIEAGFDGAQDYNFLLNVVDITNNIYHIPKILYHWRQAENSTASNFSNKRNITDAGERALDNHYRRNLIDATAKAQENRPGFYETFFKLAPKRRAIVFDLPKITQLEREFVINKYRKHKDVKKYKVALLETADTKEIKAYDEVLVVGRPAFPLDHTDNSISGLFGFLGAGYDVVMPMLVSRNKIVDCGFVSDEYGQLVPLFYGTSPQNAQYFGSSEWNRDVNALRSSLVCCTTEKYSSIRGKALVYGYREAVLGQYEFLDLKGRNETVVASQGLYYNHNLHSEMHCRIIDSQLLGDVLGAENV